MSNIAKREEKIKAKRMQTPWRTFLVEICSRAPVVYTKERWQISKFPKSNRIGWIISSADFADTDHILAQDISASGKSFFELLHDIVRDKSFPSMRHLHAENSDYADVVINSQNAYLSNTVITNCENVIYSTSVKDNSRNVFESMMVRNNCDSVFSSRSIINSYNIFYSISIHNCSNIWFCHNMIGCSECLYCDHLENVSYYIHNKAFSKEDYMREKSLLLQKKETFSDTYQNLLTVPWDNLICTNTAGKSNIECQSISNSYYCYNVHHGRNLFLHGSTKWAENAFDCFTGWSPRIINFYGVCSSWNCENIYCSGTIDEWSSNIYYSMYLGACSFCLGCIGLQNKSYCILNKQYSKEERYEKIDEIFAQMERDWTLGDFFPWSMCPFYFNDTAAYLIDPSFTKEEVTQAWYLRRDEAVKVDIPADAEVVQSSNLDQFESREPSPWQGGVEGVWVISADILKKVIQDESWNYYRIIPMEYKFLMKHWLPLPRKHWLERMKQNFKIY